LLVHPAAAAVESNNMLISKTREIFLIISNSPRQELEVALDTYVIVQCRYSTSIGYREVNINAFVSEYSDLSEKYK
jgi:hypothetical protein